MQSLVALPLTIQALYMFGRVLVLKGFDFMFLGVFSELAEFLKIKRGKKPEQNGEREREVGCVT